MTLSRSRPSVLTIILCMIASILLAGVAAVTTPKPVLAHEGDCDTFNDSSHHAGNAWNGPEAVRAAKVTIDVTEVSFRVCSHGSQQQGGQHEDGVFGWVMLRDTSGDGFIQIGIARCNYSPIIGTDDPSYCDTGGGDNGTELHYFVATKGCPGGGQAIANLGDANYSPHEFKLNRSGNNVTGSIDGVAVYTAYWPDHPRLFCWMDGNDDIEAQYSAENWDGGDGLAHSSDRMDFTNAQHIYWSEGGTWHNSNWNDPCDEIEDSAELDMHCNVLTGTGGFGNDFEVWQDHN